MNKKFLAIATATALFCSPITFADDSTTNGNDNGSATSTDTGTMNNSTTTGTSTDTSTPATTTTGTTTTSTTVTPGTTIEDLATSPTKHVDIGLKTSDGKVINAVVETSDLMGLKSGDSVTLTVPNTMSTTTTTP